MNRPSRQESRTVYSTDSGTMCPTCRKPFTACTCRTRAAVPTGDGVVRVSRETKGRKGNGVTVITGVRLAPDALQQLATQLKQLCGAGGTLKDGVIEIQGDHRERIVVALSARGLQVKRAGG